MHGGTRLRRTVGTGYAVNTVLTARSRSRSLQDRRSSRRSTASKPSSKTSWLSRAKSYKKKYIQVQFYQLLNCQTSSCLKFVLHRRLDLTKVPLTDPRPGANPSQLRCRTSSWELHDEIFGSRRAQIAARGSSYHPSVKSQVVTISSNSARPQRYVVKTCGPGVGSCGVAGLRRETESGRSRFRCDDAMPRKLIGNQWNQGLPIGPRSCDIFVDK